MKRVLVQEDAQKKKQGEDLWHVTVNPTYKVETPGISRKKLLMQMYHNIMPFFYHPASERAQGKGEGK